MRYLRQASLIHFINPETEPMFKGEPEIDELIDESERDYIHIIISDQHGTRTYRKRIT
jgi:hypothetical protein